MGVTDLPRFLETRRVTCASIANLLEIVHQNSASLNALPLPDASGRGLGGGVESAWRRLVCVHARFVAAGKGQGAFVACFGVEHLVDAIDAQNASLFQQ